MFPCGAVTALSAAQSGIGQVSHRVAEHVETVDDNRQTKPRPESQVWRHLHVFPPFLAEQATPFRSPERQIVSQEAQSSGSQDVASYVYREDDDDDSGNIG